MNTVLHMGRLYSSQDRRSSNLRTIGTSKCRNNLLGERLLVPTYALHLSQLMARNISILTRDDMTLFNHNYSHQFLTEKLTQKNAFAIKQRSAEENRHSSIDSFSITDDVMMLLVSYLKVDREYVL